MRRGEFDALDNEIVRLLQQNGRRTNAEVARELSVTEATIRARLARLVEEGWIQIMAVPTAKTLTPKLSATLRVSVRPAEMERVAEQLTAHREIRYVAISDRFDILLEAYFRDRHHMYRFITGTIAPIESVTHVSTGTVLRILKYTHEWDLSTQSVEDDARGHDGRAGQPEPAAAKSSTPRGRRRRSEPAD